MKIYSNLSDEFQLLGYSPTHNQLLIRSIKNKKRDHNIDIIFKGVLSIITTTTFKGIELSLLDSSARNSRIIKEHDFKITVDYNVYILETTDLERYFINAMCFGVYHNRLDILETSLGRYDEGNRGENVLWFCADDK